MTKIELVERIKLRSIAKMEQLPGLSGFSKLSLVEDTPLKKTNNVKIKFSIKEYNEYCNSIDLLAQLATSSEFVDFAKRKKGPSFDFNKEILYPIVNSKSKVVYKGKKKEVTKAKSQEALESSFFTKSHKGTKQTKLLHDRVKAYPEAKQNDFEKNSIFSVIAMVKLYMKETGDITFIKSLAPSFFSSSGDFSVANRSQMISLSKEIIRFVPSK